jgi:hypothetical protein
VLSKVTIVPRQAQREGITFRFAGQQEDENGVPLSEFVDIELVVPPLNLDALRLLEGRLHSLEADPSVKSMKTMVDAIGHALRRNYSGVPVWLIEQTLDVANMPELTRAFMDVGGLKRKEIEAGKAKAAAEA